MHTGNWINNLWYKWTTLKGNRRIEKQFYERKNCVGNEAWKKLKYFEKVLDTFRSESWTF